ncbi:MAG: hypothetical protein JSU65_06960 [Candidatus Zixiibacteriota bacterium]|nr:MAG: hypothetical protein JSU65_06960 [candidate division Zixibacteria bacterium]
MLVFLMIGVFAAISESSDGPYERVNFVENELYGYRYEWSERLQPKGFELVKITGPWDEDCVPLYKAQMYRAPTLCDSNVAVFWDADTSVHRLITCRLSDSIMVDTILITDGLIGGRWFRHRNRFAVSIQDSVLALISSPQGEFSATISKLSEDEGLVFLGQIDGAIRVSSTFDFKQFVFERYVQRDVSDTVFLGEVVVYDIPTDSLSIISSADMHYSMPAKRFRDGPLYFIRGHKRAHGQLCSVGNGQPTRVVFEVSEPEFISGFGLLRDYIWVSIGDSATGEQLARTVRIDE